MYKMKTAKDADPKRVEKDKKGWRNLYVDGGHLSQAGDKNEVGPRLRSDPRTL